MLEDKNQSWKHVIPRWRHWKRDVLGAIATDSNQIQTSTSPECTIIVEDLIREFSEYRKHRNQAVASRLLNSAVLTSQREITRHLANDIVERNVLHPAAVRSAKRILSGQNIYTPEAEIPIVRAQLGEIKKTLREFPKSAVLWIERARLYTILGQKDKSLSAIKCALSLEPFNRIIVRSAVRCFIHYECWDEAWYYSSQAALATRDPWLLSLAISVGSHKCVNKRIRGVRGKPQLPDATKSEFTLSELNEAIATLELTSGNDQNSRRIFRQAWLDPASTVISHGVWVLNEKIPGLKDSVYLDVERSIQAKALAVYNDRDYENALVHFRTWVLEEPYSSEPFTFMTNILTGLEDYDGAVTEANRGLSSNPGDKTLLNNKAYALLRSRDPSDWKHAGLVLKELERVYDFEEDPVCIATLGMYKMFTQDEKVGIEHYRNALKQFRKKRDQESYLICIANLVTNCLRVFGGYIKDDTERIVRQLNKSERNSSIDARNMLLNELKKHKNPFDLKDVDNRDLQMISID